MEDQNKTIRTRLRRLLFNSYGFYSKVCALIILAIGTLISCVPSEPSSKTIVFEGATLIIGDGTFPLENSVVMVQEDRIVNVAKKGEISYPSNSQIINLDGKWLLPGFMDLHFHINNQEQQEALTTLLQFGITTFRITAAAPEFGIELRDKIASGEVKGPRMFTCGKLIDITGGFWSDSPSAAGVATVEEMRAEVRRQVKTGVDYVKLYAHLEPEIIRAGIDEAKSVGVKTIGHLGKTSWTDAAKMGINAVTHSGTAAPTWELVPPQHQARFKEFFAPHQKPEFDPMLFAPWRKLVDLDGQEMSNLVSAIVKNRVEVNPTLVIVEVMFWGDDPEILETYEPDFAPASLGEKWRGAPHPYTASWSKEALDEAKKVFLINQGIVRRLHEAGALVTTGTDFPLPWITPGVSLHREMMLLHNAGIPPLEVITIATKNGAEALGILDDVGTIESGKRADFVILKADPLIDIKNTRKLEAVYLSGERVFQTKEINN
jgi:imidazolonepropionase-like amidohydrolase